MTHYILAILPTIQHLGVFGYWVVFLFALLESLAFIGVVIPGAVVVVFAGFLSAQGYLDLVDLMWFAALGAILGDSISYYLGSRGKYLFKPESRFFKLSHLEKGEQFFERHGGKSIFLGRFIGPLRPIVPFIAGLSKMRMRTFLKWNIASGILWAAAHVLLGYLFGNALSLIGVWSSRIGLFVVFALACTLFGWYGISRSRPFFLFLASILKSIIRAVSENPDVLRFKEAHPTLITFVQRRLDPHHFRGRTLTILSLAILYVLALLSGIVEDVVRSDIIVSVDQRVANLVFAFRDTELLHFFTWITFLGKWEMVVVGTMSTAVLLWLWGRGRFVVPLLVAMGGAELFTTIGKIAFHRTRPDIAYYIEHGFSFPSGHATIAVAFYGFLGYILVRTAPTWSRRVTYAIGALSLIALIGISRIYLGVHYVSDVLAGYAVGFLWLLIAIAISEWLFSRNLDASVPRKKRLRIVTMLILFAWFAALGFLEVRYQPVRADPTEMSPVIVVDTQTALASSTLSLFTETITGARQEPISVVIIASDEQRLIDSFENAGWLVADPATLKNTLVLASHALTNTPYPRAPMSPSFWNTRVHDIGFEKETATQTVRSRHHARVWRTALQTQRGQHVYVVTVSLDIGLKWGITHTIDPNIDADRDLLLRDLESAGTLADVQKIQLIQPILGKNFSGDVFFTDGMSYVAVLK